MRSSLLVSFFAVFLLACPSDPSPTDAGHGAGGACSEITEACHDLDTGTGPIAECHDLGHDGPIATCESRLADCVALCTAARGDGGPRSDGGAGSDGGPRADSGHDEHDGGEDHDHDGGH